MRRILCIYFAATLYVAITGPAHGAAVYSQVTPVEPIGAFTSTDRLGYPKVADSFLLNVAQPTTVRSIRFIGGYLATMPPPITPPLDSLPTDNFRVVFLADEGGSPGLPIPGGDFALGGAARRNPTGGALLNGFQFPIEYALDLASGITLSPNTVYWISILDDPGPLYGWSWARAAGATDQKLAYTEGDVPAGPWNTYATGGMFFALDDTNVPEPASGTIFIVGLLALMGIRISAHRRKPSCS